MPFFPRQYAVHVPFSQEQFFAVFAQYNHAVWPAQFALFALACFAVYFAALPSKTYDRIALSILAFLWVWSALAYHAAFFWKINPAAPVFAIAFLLQAFALWRVGVARGAVTLHLRNDLAGWIGSAAIFYALIVYPIITSGVFGHRFPELPTFGLPCPTVIYTFGLLLWARPLPHLLFVIPTLWALVGTAAAASLAMPPDFGLPAVALAAWGIMGLGMGSKIVHALHLPMLRS